MTDNPAAAAIGRLLRELGRNDPYSVERLPTGRNNRLFLVRTQSRRFVAKFYLRDARDTRDRLLHETSFLKFANEAGIPQVPLLYGFDRDSYFTLLGHIEGNPVAPADVTEDLVAQAMAFVLALNEAGRAQAQLPDASEACFSIERHLAVVDGRLSRLAAETTDPAAVRFLSETLAPAWQPLRAAVVARAGARIAEVLPHEQRCVSPSDFGFHNALRREPDGRLAFFDFEYAGRDDPAKLFSDFFCQVAVPVPARYMASARAALSRLGSDPAWFEARCRLLLPVYRIKWACIVLSELLPAYTARRRFAGAEAGAAVIGKARRLLRMAEEPFPA